MNVQQNSIDMMKVIKPNKIVILHVLILIYVFYDNECAILYCSDFVQGV